MTGNLDYANAPADIPAELVREWRDEYREYAEDRLGWVPLWTPFLADKVAAYRAKQEVR